MNGTFKIVPEWYQNGGSVRVVLQSKTVIYDFETALIPALQGTFPGVNIQGCYFHFCQAVLRK
ncbi:hypothetical protein T12_12266, partial [Trichinella patagoniensis]